MAELTNYYSPDDEPNVGFDPMPADKYPIIITDTRMKPTRNSAGEYLEFEEEVTDGPFKGRKLWDRLTLKHPNEMTVKIARGTLAQIRNAIGIRNPKNSIELHNLPLIAVVGVKKRSDTGELTNFVKGYLPKARTQSPVTTAGGLPPAYQR